MGFPPYFYPKSKERKKPAGFKHPAARIETPAVRCRPSSRAPLQEQAAGERHVRALQTIKIDAGYSRELPGTTQGNVETRTAHDTTTNRSRNTAMIMSALLPQYNLGGCSFSRDAIIIKWDTEVCICIYANRCAHTFPRKRRTEWRYVRIQVCAVRVVFRVQPGGDLQTPT